ncbi:MAG TPA: MFS transporter [Devosiaceae bacterium]
MSLQQRVLWLFFLQPVAFGAWIPRIPQIQTKLALDPAGLALALAGGPVGTLITLLFADRLVHALGARQTTLVFFPVFFAVMALPLLAPTLPLLALSLALMSASISILELGLNVLASEAERLEKRIIMSKAHGFWSLGLMAGTALGAIAAGLHVAPIAANLAITLFALPAAMWFGRELPRAAPPASSVPGKIALPHPVLLLICLYVFGTALTEGAVADWSAIYMRDAFGSTPGIGGLAVSAFSLAVALTRMMGDRLRQRFGPARLGRTLAFVGLAGVLLVVFAPSESAGILGFVLVGIGASVAFPIGVSAAVEAPGRNTASNVATLSFIALTGFLIGPLLIGSITQLAGIRAGLGVLFPMLALSALLAPVLNRPRITR